MIGSLQLDRDDPKEVSMSTEQQKMGAALKIGDVYLALNHLFSPAAKQAFKVHVKDMFHNRYIEPLGQTAVDTVRFFGSRSIGERGIYDAAQRVAKGINELALKGYVTGAMVKLAIFKLHNEPHELEQYCVISYVAVSQQGLDYLKNQPLSVAAAIEFEPGAIPNLVELVDNYL